MVSGIGSVGLVVGVDGSAASMAAVAWAAAEAADRRRPLSLCHVIDQRWLADVSISGAVGENVQANARALLDRAAAVAGSVDAAAHVEGRLLEGHPAAELIRFSIHADEIVLGTRGHGGFGGLLLGSVSAHVAAHSTRPVIVVRERRHPAGPVLVGVDGSHYSDRAVVYAFDFAARHQLPLRALHCYSDPLTRPGLGTVPLEVSGTARAAAEQCLSDSVSPWKSKYPQVDVDRVMIPDTPARLLVDMSELSSLVVVGSRGHGPLVGMLLGSVSQAVLRHAHATVAVIR
jgi:nucleotide-binding universal stress UspA family protein